MPRKVELVRVRTVDGIRLDGALQEPLGDSSQRSTTGVILFAGVGGNFYGSAMLDELANACIQQGNWALRVNTRGHDGVTTVSTDVGGRQQGAAYEIVDECRHDVSAWVECLVSHGCTEVILVGHSLGAVKILYAQAQQPLSVVSRLIAISPPRLAYSEYLHGKEQRAFHESLQQAQQWIDQQRPSMLFASTFPFPMVLSAATFVDKYGPAERYNFLRFTSQIETPVHFIYGAQELEQPSSSFANLEQEIRAASWGSGEMTFAVVPGANHFFSGKIAELAATVGRYWV